MFKYGLGYINAGENDIHRYGRKAQERAKMFLEPNEAGYYSIPVDGEKWYTIGTSNGKFGEFCKMNGTIFSVNSMGSLCKSWHRKRREIRRSDQGHDRENGRNQQRKSGRGGKSMRIAKIKEEYKEICQMAGYCATCKCAVEGLVKGSLPEYTFGCSHPEVIKAAEKTIEVR